MCQLPGKASLLLTPLNVLPHLVPVKCSSTLFIDALLPEDDSLVVLRESLNEVHRGNHLLLAHKSQPHLEDKLASNQNGVRLILELIVEDLVAVECSSLYNL